jgi:hypothetical protein
MDAMAVESPETDQPDQMPLNLADLIPAVAIGAADPEELNAVLAALAEQPELASQLADYATLRQALLYSSPPFPAPAALETRVRAALAASPPIAPSSPVAFKSRRHSVVRNFFASPLRLAAAAVIGMLVVANLYWLNQVAVLRMTQAALREKVDLQAQAVAMLADTTPQETVLPSPEGSTASEASVLWNPDWRVGVLYAHEFPPLAPDMAYQLWLTKDGQRTSAGLFTVDETGNGSLVFRLPIGIDDLDSLGVTPEPAGGSPGPTAPPVVRLQL